jgi:hypothetical protein
LNGVVGSAAAWRNSFTRLAVDDSAAQAADKFDGLLGVSEPIGDARPTENSGRLEGVWGVGFTWDSELALFAFTNDEVTEEGAPLPPMECLVFFEITLELLKPVGEGLTTNAGAGDIKGPAPV